MGAGRPFRSLQSSLVVVFLAAIFVTNTLRTSWRARRPRSYLDLKAARVSISHSIRQADHFASLPHVAKVDVYGERCTICHLPKFCISTRGNLVFDHAVEAQMRNISQMGLCNMKTENTTTVRFRTRTASYVEFEDISMHEFEDVDALNVDLADPFALDAFEDAGYGHMPHNLERSFMKTWRMMSFLTSVCEGKSVGGGLSNACAALKLGVFVPDKVRTRSVDWFTGLHALIERAYPVKVVDESDSFADPNREKYLCYRSAFVEKCKSGHGPPFLNDFRNRVATLPEFRQQTGRRAKSKQRIHIGFLSREGTRSLVGIESIKEYIVETYKPHGDIAFETFKFDNMTFMQQVLAMQNTDILVASHGAGLTNLVFMKEGAHVMEYQVFGLPRAKFTHFARIAGLEHQTIMSRPDVRTVEDCLERNRLVEFLREWRETVSNPFDEISTSDYEGFGNCSHCVRSCLREQHLYVEPEVVGARIVDSVRLLKETRTQR